MDIIKYDQINLMGMSLNANSLNDSIVSKIGLGCWGLGGDSYGNVDSKTAKKSIRIALKYGCNFFDTAQNYGMGESEIRLGKVLNKEAERENIIIATKVGNDVHQSSPPRFDSEYILSMIDGSLKRLKTDYIDLYQLHNPPVDLIVENDGEIFDPLIELKNQGKIKAIGISVYNSIEGRAAIRIMRKKSEKLDAIQIVFNMLNPEPIKGLFPLAKSEGVSIIAREPLANGFLINSQKRDRSNFSNNCDIRKYWKEDIVTEKFYDASQFDFLSKSEGRTLSQAAIQYVLSFNEVLVTIPGSKNPKHVVENFKSLSVKQQMTKREKKKIAKIQLKDLHPYTDSDHAYPESSI